MVKIQIQEKGSPFPLLDEFYGGPEGHCALHDVPSLNRTQLALLEDGWQHLHELRHIDFGEDFVVGVQEGDLP
jgi:hypothetical protein